MPKNKTVYDMIIATYPELAEDTKAFALQTIILQNDGDGAGDYIKTWNYSKPLTPELEAFYRP